MVSRGEAAYYISVTHDILKNLDAVLLQICGARYTREDDAAATLGRKVSRTLQERIPKLLDQLWHEILLELSSSLTSQELLGGGAQEEVWDTLAEECAQLSFFRCIHKCVMSVSPLTGEGITGGSDEFTNYFDYYRSLELLLSERENTLASQDGQAMQQWLMGVVKHVPVIAQICGEEERGRLEHLEESLGLGEESQQEYNQQEQQERRRLLNHWLLHYCQDESAISKEHIQYEELTFFREACIGVARDIFSFVKQKMCASVPSSMEVVDIQEEGRKKEGNEGRRNTPDPREEEEEKEKNENAGEWASDLTAGDERWIFFRIHANNNPKLSISEVTRQVRAFYGVYNPVKISMASVLAEGYGDDYADLFDALECRYCFTDTENTLVTTKMAPAAFEAPRQVEETAEVITETLVDAQGENGSQANNCVLM